MIRRVRLANFKRFRDQSFDLDDSVVLAGPNNSGKSTLMQAIAWWRGGPRPVERQACESSPVGQAEGGRGESAELQLGTGP